MRVLVAEDFPPAFVFVGLVSASSILLFSRLPADAGAELADRKPAAPGPDDAQKAA